MTTHLGKRDAKRLERIRDIVSEELMGQLIFSETLFYVLIDEIKLEIDDANALAMKIFSGENSRDAKELAIATQEDGIQYGVSARQMPFFMKRFVRSTRIKMLDTNPLQWQMNGFKTFERPYICGYERPTLETLCTERQFFIKQINKIDKKLSVWPDNVKDLYLERNKLHNQVKVLNNKINKESMGVMNG